MAEPKIVFSPVLDPDVEAIGRQKLPSGFAFEVVDRAELPDALREADYLMGFIGSLSEDALRAASRLKLAQLMSAGYDRFNLAAARAAKLPVAVNGGANAIAVAEHAIMLMLTTLKH